MDKKLYYCKAWPHKMVSFEKNEYDICISPKIDGNKEGTSIQYHGVIIKDASVARLGLINAKLSFEQAENLIASFEEKIRNILGSNVTWVPDAIDNGTVKIWYYEEDDKIVNTYEGDKRKYPPLRFAITLININPISDKQSDIIRKGIEDTLSEWIEIAQYK